MHKNGLGKLSGNCRPKEIAQTALPRCPLVLVTTVNSKLALDREYRELDMTSTVNPMNSTNSRSSSDLEFKSFKMVEGKPIHGRAWYGPWYQAKCKPHRKCETARPRIIESSTVNSNSWSTQFEFMVDLGPPLVPSKVPRPTVNSNWVDQEFEFMVDPI